MPTGAFVAGVSAVGHAALADDVDGFDRLRNRNATRKHTNDALVASAAQQYGVPLCVRDKSVARRAQRSGVRVMSPLEVLVMIGYDPAKEIAWGIERMETRQQGQRARLR